MMANFDHIDDVNSEDSAPESDMESSDVGEHQQHGHRTMTSQPGNVLHEPHRPLKRQRKPTAKILESCTGADVIRDHRTKTSVKKVVIHNKSSSISCDVQQSFVSCVTSSVAPKKDRLLLKDWLKMTADRKLIKNVQWYDNEQTMIKVPWKHGSRSGWTEDDCQLYREWAKYTGKYNTASDDEPKRWKANFRCALNSLPDVEEVKQLSQSRGADPYKVYKLYPTAAAAAKYSPRKGQTTKKPRKTRRNKIVEQTFSSSKRQQQPQLSKTSAVVNSKTATTSNKNVGEVAHQVSAAPTPLHVKTPAAYDVTSPQSQPKQPVVPLAVASMHLSTMNISHGSMKDVYASDSGLVNAPAPMTSSYSDVIPTTVEEMSCDDDDCSNTPDSSVIYNTDYNCNRPSLETELAIENLLMNGRQRQLSGGGGGSSISDSSSGYMSDSVGSPDGQLEVLDNLDPSDPSFEFTNWCVSDDDDTHGGAVPQFDIYPEMTTDLTHGYAIGLQFSADGPNMYSPFFTLMCPQTSTAQFF